MISPPYRSQPRSAAHQSPHHSEKCRGFKACTAQLSTWVSQGHWQPLFKTWPPALTHNRLAQVKNTTCKPCLACVQGTAAATYTTMTCAGRCLSGWCAALITACPWLQMTRALCGACPRGLICQQDQLWLQMTRALCGACPRGLICQQDQLWLQMTRALCGACPRGLICQQDQLWLQMTRALCGACPRGLICQQDQLWLQMTRALCGACPRGLICQQDQLWLPPDNTGTQDRDPSHCHPQLTTAGAARNLTVQQDPGLLLRSPVSQYCTAFHILMQMLPAAAESCSGFDAPCMRGNSAPQSGRTTSLTLWYPGQSTDADGHANTVFPGAKGGSRHTPATSC